MRGIAAVLLTSKKKNVMLACIRAFTNKFEPAMMIDTFVLYILIVV